MAQDIIQKSDKRTSRHITCLYIVVYYSRQLFVVMRICVYIVDTDSKIQEEECLKVIKIHLSLTNGLVENNRSIFPTHQGVESEIIN